jgi:tape measure domain-containing protein
MSFSAADLVATIQLGGVDTAARDLDRFRGKLNDTDAVASKIGKTAEATFRGTATAIGVAGTAAAVYVAKLFSTGVAYNQLQQTSRAALRTLMGGAEQANAQMDKLDAFARNSPFSKSVFISAQQQLIGFGFEAQKVIPILDAVQNSVAAVGGSNQQISEIVSILAKIRSSGKLTAEDFNMLGERGLDAATMLGQGFGKSAAEIRDQVTKGTLGAGEAIDMLVSQMGTKFAGAASNVKETFAGTKDRIAAASRDIGAALAEPFVSKNGGGLAVVWGNQVADVMRAVESHVSPVVTMLVGRAMPAFAGITTTLEQARVQIRSWDSSRLEQGLDAMANHAPGLAAMAGAVLGVNSQLLASLPIVGRFVPAFGPLAGALAGVAMASPELRKELGALMGELKPLLPVTLNLAKTMSGVLNAALPIVASGISAVVAVAGPLADIISQIPSPMLATALAGVAVFVAMRNASPAIEGFVDGLRRIGEQVAVQAALASMEGNTSVLAGTFGVAGKAATGFGNSLKAAFVANPVGLIILGVSTAAAVLTAVLSSQAQQAQKTKERIQGYRDTLTATGETTAATVDKIRESIQEFANVETNIFTNGSVTSAKDWVESMGGADQALAKFGVTSKTVADAVRDGGAAYDTLLDSLKEYGSETEKIKTTSGVKDQLTDSANAANLLKDSITEQRSAVQLAAEIQAEYNKRMQEASAAMTETERSNTRMNEALAIARDVSRDATERLRALKQALDELNGGTKSTADRTQELNDQVRSLESAFAAVDDGGRRLADSLIAANGEIDTSTAAGSELRTQVTGLRDDYLGAMQAAYDMAKANGESGLSMDRAREVAAPYQEALRNAATEAGVAAEKIDAFVSAALETPEVVAYTLTDNGTVDAEKVRVLDLAQQILATPNGDFDITQDSIPGLMEALRALGVKVTTLPNGRISVTKDGAAISSVESALNNLARSRTARIFTRVDPGPGNDPAGRWATGGPVFGPGSGTSDSVPALLSNGEHVVTAAEVAALGGHGAWARIRRAAKDGTLQVPRFADGGPVYELREPVSSGSMLAVRSSASASAGTADLSGGEVLALLRMIVDNLARPSISFTEHNPVHTDPISDRLDQVKLMEAST